MGTKSLFHVRTIGERRNRAVGIVARVYSGHLYARSPRSTARRFAVGPENAPCWPVGSASAFWFGDAINAVTLPPAAESAPFPAPSDAATSETPASQEAAPAAEDELDQLLASLDDSSAPATDAPAEGDVDAELAALLADL